LTPSHSTFSPSSLPRLPSPGWFSWRETPPAGTGPQNAAKIHTPHPPYLRMVATLRKMVTTNLRLLTSSTEERQRIWKAESSSVRHIYLAKNILPSYFFVKKLNQQTVRAILWKSLKCSEKVRFRGESDQ
jgi:hypothetical protein